MDQTLFYWILGVAGAIIALLIGVIGFFFKQNYNTNKEAKCTMDKLNTTLRVLIQKMKSYDEKNDVTTLRLNDHAKRLDTHDVKIATIEERMKK